MELRVGDITQIIKQSNEETEKLKTGEPNGRGQVHITKVPKKVTGKIKTRQ